MGEGSLVFSPKNPQVAVKDALGQRELQGRETASETITLAAGRVCSQARVVAVGR